MSLVALTDQCACADRLAGALTITFASGTQATRHRVRRTPHERYSLILFAPLDDAVTVRDFRTLSCRAAACFICLPRAITDGMALLPLRTMPTNWRNSTCMLDLSAPSYHGWIVTPVSAHDADELAILDLLVAAVRPPRRRLNRCCASSRRSRRRRGRGSSRRTLRRRRHGGTRRVAAGIVDNTPLCKLGTSDLRRSIFTCRGQLRSRQCPLRSPPDNE